MKFGDYLKNRKNQTETESKKTVSENSFGAYLQGREAEKVESLYQSYLKDVQDLSNANKARFFDDKGNYIEKYRADSDEWYNSSARATNLLKSKAQKIRKYLDDYGGYHDDEYVSQLRTQLDSNDSYLDDLLKSAEDHKEYNSQWKDEDAYNAEMMDWLEEDYKSTPEKVKARRDRFKSNTDRVAQIKEEIKALEAKRSEAFSNPNTSMDVVATYDDKIAALEDERDKLKVENRKYERHHKTDSYFDVTQNEDFAETSAKREFTNPTEAELDKYDSDLYNAERWYADNAVYGATKDENGNVYDAKGNLKFSVTPASVEDKLGLFLSASKDDVARASNELANNTDANNTWASIISEGSANDWSQLDDEELGIYYSLLNTKGQKEAYKFLDDMTVELNRRANEEMEKEISGASLLEKLAYSAASTPVNIISGVPALIDNVSHIVQGEEINPYSKANSLMNFASASRGAMAEEINEWTGNASLPYIGTTWGDAYQAVMSGADSWVGAATFGPSYLSLMSSNAAASKMKEMYESGASTSQMIIGGGVAGAAEYLFEKLPLEGMLKILKGKDLKGGRAIASAWLKQSATEAFEEMGTEATNILADALVLGSQSDLAGYVDKYMANGDSKGLAIWKALAYDVAPEVINAGISGLISGGAIGGVASVAKYANYRAETTNQGKDILAKKGVPALKAFADEVSGVTEGKLGKDISKLSSKVSATPLEGKNKLSTAIKNRKNAYDIGRLSDMVDTARISLNTADVVSALEEKGLSSKEAKKGAEAIISRINGEDVELDNLKVAEVYDELVGEGESQLKESITDRNIQYTATRLGIDTKNRTVDGKSIEKEVSTEGRVAESGKTTRISTGEEITIDKSNPIAKTKTVDGVDKIFFNTNKGVVEASDITYANENEALIYESFTDLHPSVASAVIKAYDGTVPAQTYIKGMREGILLYGKHNFQAVGKDISVNSDLAQLSSADQALALKLGKAVANIETSNADKALKSAIKFATEKAEKDTAEGKKTEKKGKVSFREGAKPQGHSQKRAVTLAKVLSKAIGIDIVFYDSMRATERDFQESNGMFDPDTDTMYLDLQHSTDDAHTIAFTMSHELVHFVKKYSPAKFKVFADFLMEEYAKHGVSTSSLLGAKMEFLKTDDTDLAYEEMIADACERMLLDSNVMLKLAKLKQIDLDLFEKIRLHILDILNKIRAEYKRMNYAPRSKEAKALLKMEDVIGKLHEKFEEMVVDATETFQALDTESVKVSEDGTIMMQMKQYETTGRDTLLKYLRQQYGNDNANDLISTMDNLYNAMVDIKKDTALSVFGNWQEQEVELDENGHPIFTTSINNGDYVLNQDFSRVCKKRRQLNFVLNMLAEDPAFEASNLTKDDIVKINQAIKSHGFEIACALCFVDSKRYRQTEWADSFANTWNDILYSVVKDKSKLTPFNFATQNPNTNDDGIEIDTSKPVMYRKWSNGKEDVKNRRNHDSFDRMLEKTEDNKFVEGNSNVRAIVRILKNNPHLRHTFRGADIIASDGFDMIQRLAPDVRSILDGWGGTSVPKPSSNDAIYDNSVLNIDGYNAKKAFAIGGVSMNSFSDFMAHMFFDYAQAFADLSAKKLPMHSYTKELDFARLFGLTRGKINMSAIAAIRENATDLSKVKGEANKEAVTKWEKSIAGLDISKLADKLGKAETDITYDDVVQNLDDCEYVWADESIDVQNATLLQSGIMYDNLTEGKAAYCYELIKEGKFDEAFKVAGEENVNKEYAKHLGIITVGVSKAHILKLMRDPTIRMVIPYHKSGLNAQVAKALKILFYEDFTDVQNTMLKLKDGSTVGLSKDGAKIKDKNIRDFNFYDYFGKTIDGVFYDGKATASKYLEWCEKGEYNAETGEYGYYLTDGTFVTKAELDSKGLSVIPKFSEFAEEENYYKLIEDFDCYDTITGEHSSQEAVDFLREDALPADYKNVLLRALKAEQKVSDDFKDHLDNQGLRDEIMEIVGKHGYVPSKNIKKQAKKLNVKDASKLSEMDLRYLLEEAQNGGLYNSSYIPLRRNTPEFFIGVVKEHSKGTRVIKDFPIASRVEHMTQNMEEVDGQSYGNKRPHELSIDDIVTISRKMGDPSYIVLQENQRYAMVVSFYNKRKKRVIVAIDMANDQIEPPKNYKYAQYMNGYNEGYYNIVVTQYEPDSLQKYLNDCEEVIYDKEKMNGKYQVGSGRVVTVTHDTPFIEDIVSQDNPKVKKQLKRDSNGKELSLGQQEYFKDSKVRDAEGRLIPVYHGTPNKFTVFKPRMAQGWGTGIYFTDNKDATSEYGDNLVEVYLNITNPFNADTMSYDDIGAENTKAYRDFDIEMWKYRGDEYDTYEEYKADGAGVDMYEIYTEEVEVFNKILRELGYDGIIADHSNNIDGLEIVAFYDNQPKLTTNLNPTKDKDIRFQKKKRDVGNDIATFNGKPFWMALTNRKTGEIVKTWTEQEVRDNGYDPMFLYASANVPVTKGDEYVYITTDLIQEDGTVMYDDFGESLPKGLAQKINEQIKVSLPKTISLSALETAFEEEFMASNDSSKFKDFKSWVKAKGSEYVAEDILTGWGTESSVTDTMQSLIDAKYHSAKESNPDMYDIELTDYLVELIDKYVSGQIEDADLRYTEIVNNKKSTNLNDWLLDDDIRFQKKQPSNRELLSNALESTIDTSSAEGKVLQEYKNNIGKIEELEAHLAEVKTEIYKLSFGKGARDTARLKELNEDKVKTTNRINIYDKKLLRIEATKPLKDILVREKEKVRKAEKQKGEEALRKLREKDAATLREVMERNQESRRKNVEGRQKTEMRNKIKGVVGNLNKMFKAGRKKANVKAGMRDTVAQALATAELLFSNDITNEDIVRNGVTVATSAESKKLNRYMDLLSKRETYLNKIDVMMGASLSANIDEERQMVEKISKEIRVLDKELKDVFERERNRLNEVVISSAIQDLADAYKSIKDSEQSYISAAYNEYVYDRLLLLKDEVGGSSIRDMSMDQLRNVYEAYKMVLHVVRTANTLFKDGKAVDDIADAVVSEIKSIAKPRNRSVPTELLNRAVWGEMKPRTAFEKIGSDTLLGLYDNLRKGEDTFAMDVYEAFEFANSARKRHNYKKWDMKSRIDFKLESGKTFSVNLQQLMSIYAYSKREQAHKHMTNGGFVFDSKETFTKKKSGIIERLPTAETYRLSVNDISKIINTLAEKYSDAKAYVDEMQKYLTDMGEKGNEVSRLVFGIDLFKEKVYFPLQSSRDYLRSNNDALDKKNATPSLINSGMTKETTPNAENPIVLSGFDNVWASHTNKMSLYHSFVPALEDFRKVYEYSSSSKGTDYVSVRAEITNVFGANATDYISKFIDDVNGGMPGNEMSNPIMSLFSTFKKTSVGMSLSTVIQQPTAIIRAWSILNPKYFAGVPHNNFSSAQWDEIKRYAPIAILKEIGGFDAGSGRGMVDYLAGDVNKTWLKKTSSAIDDASMWLAGKGDVLGWGMIWNAVKREVADTTNLTEGSEEFLEKCGERFTEVITETQVYDSTFSRSGYMRSKNELNKFATSFMAEPTTAINMLYRAVINAKRGKISKAQAVGTIASVVLSQFMASALVSLIYAARDDDEDESYLEKYFESLGGRIRDDINVLNMLPYLRDIQSLFDGWDVERPDMAIFADIKKAYDGLQSKTKSPYMKWRDFISAISNAFGVPLGNLERDLRAVFYNVPKMLFDDATPTFENSLEAFGDGLADKDTSMKERAWNAHKKGDTSKVKRTVAEMVEAKVKSGKTEKEAKSDIRSSFTLTYKKIYLDALDDKDHKTMNDIRRFLFSTGLYGSLSELDKSLENWRKSK